MMGSTINERAQVPSTLGRAISGVALHRVIMSIVYGISTHTAERAAQVDDNSIDRQNPWSLDGYECCCCCCWAAFSVFINACINCFFFFFFFSSLNEKEAVARQGKVRQGSGGMKAEARRSLRSTVAGLGVCRSLATTRKNIYTHQ